MKLNYYLAVGLILIWPLFTSCQGDQSGKYAGFQQTESGILYKIHDDQGGDSIKANVYIDFHMIQKNAKDSIIGNTYDSTQAPFLNTLFPEDTTKGNLTEAFQLLSEGDSATFALSTDKLMATQDEAIQQTIEGIKKEMESRLAQAPNDSVKTLIQSGAERRIKQIEEQREKIAESFPPGKFIEYTVKILDVKDTEEFQAKEIEDIKKYAQDNSLDVKSTPSGLHYVITEEGEGDKIEKGDSAKVHYAGKLLTGQLFDTSLEDVAKANNRFQPGRPYTPFPLVVGVGGVIPGWDEGLQLLRQGDKATLLIPSNLGYGPQGAGRNIPPNATLIFDVEIVEVTKNAQ